MNDIPVGSPPAPRGRHAAPSGWYADPVDQSRERYWDGWQWSRDTRPGPNAPGPATSGQQPYPQQQNPAYGQQQPYPPQGEQTYGRQDYGQQQAYGQPSGYVSQGQLRPVPCTNDGVRLASWWWRVLAIAIDGLIVGVIVTLASIPILSPLIAEITSLFRESFEAAQQGLAPPSAADFNPDTGSALWLIVIQGGIGLAYNALFLRFKGATPGKLMVGLRVVPLQQGRFSGRLGWGVCLVRSIVWTLPVLFGSLLVSVFLRLVDALMALSNPRKQTVHDLIAKTQVIRP